MVPFLCLESDYQASFYKTAKLQYLRFLSMAETIGKQYLRPTIFVLETEFPYKDQVPGQWAAQKEITSQTD